MPILRCAWCKEELAVTVSGWRVCPEPTCPAGPRPQPIGWKTDSGYI